ncbi:MAG: hypothetical protein GX938_09315 [Spirochaetales bacterium]|nr:hypothetical protein [Spirochaetales bacterium]
MARRKGESISARELRKYAKENYPGSLVKSNKPYSKGAAIIDPDTGRIFQEGESNFAVIDKETDPNKEALKTRKELLQLFYVEPEIRLKNYSEKCFTQGLCWILEGMEMANMPWKKISFPLDEDGFPKSVKVGNLEFDLHGMKKKKEWE